MTYESRPLIKRMKELSSPNGYTSFHLEWSIGKLRNIPMRSRKFGTGLASSRARELEWQFEIRRIPTEDHVLIRLKSLEKEKRYLFDVYMARIMLRNKRTENDQFGLSYLFANKPLWKISIDKSHQVDDDYVLHCFLDTPTDMHRMIYNDGPEKHGHGLVSLVIADLFEEVIDETGGNSTSDVFVITKQDGVERRFYCHRNILCARSLVFKTMLLNEKFDEARQRCVRIDDIDTETMQLVLKYVYTGQFGRSDASKDDLAMLMNAAEKYDLPELIEQCALAFMHLYDEDIDRMDLLQCAELYCLDWIKRLCLRSLSTNMGVLLLEEFRNALFDGPMEELNAIEAKRIESTKLVVIASLIG